MRAALVLFVFYLLHSLPCTSFAQADTYITIHQSSLEYILHSLTDLEEKVYKKYTIHSAKAQSDATLIIPYDKFSKIIDAEIQYTNKFGILIKKYKLKDFIDQVMFDGFSIFSDNRMKAVRANITDYPMTIEYSYSIKHKNTLGLSSWHPIDGYHTAVTSASLSLKSEIPDLVAIKEIHFNGKKTNQNGTMTWQLDSLSPVESEAFSAHDLFPIVMLSPLQIDVDGYKGSLLNWKKYGIWINQLNEQREELNPEDQLKFKKLVSSHTTSKSKIATLYKYLQNNTRYVSIQLGIGGWQPMPASDVSKFGYGDCKALSNYMRAILKSVGIESYYTIIGNGSRKIKYPDYVSFNQMNHAVLTVPLLGDTTFLECTSQFYPPGYAGSSNSDRYALMASPTGGQLIRTPVYNQQSNRRIMKASLKLESTGNASALVSTMFQGEYYEPYSIFGTKSLKEQKDELLELHDEVDYAVDSFSFNYDFSAIPIFNLNEHLSLRKYASVSGTRLFIPMYLIQRYEPPLAQKPRLSGIEIPNGLTEIDSIFIQIPPGYEIENLPKPMTIQNIFGSSNVKTELKQHMIVVTNHFQMLKNNEPKEAYIELHRLLESAFKSTRSKIVLKKNTP